MEVDVGTRFLVLVGRSQAEMDSLAFSSFAEGGT